MEIWAVDCRGMPFLDSRFRGECHGRGRETLLGEIADKFNKAVLDFLSHIA